MFPVSASGLGRFTTEPTVLGGYLIPAGVEVQVRPLLLWVTSECDRTASEHDMLCHHELAQGPSGCMAQEAAWCMHLTYDARN